MPNEAHPFLFSHNFKMILDTRKTEKKTKPQNNKHHGQFL